MKKTQPTDKRTLLAKVVFIIGIVLWNIGGATIPSITLIAEGSPTDGPLIIDRWATFQHCFPAYAIIAAGGLLMTTSGCYVLWRSFIAGFREATVQQDAAADRHKPHKFNPNHACLTRRQS